MRGIPEFDCPHEHAGTIGAGDWRTEPHCSVSVCILPSCQAEASRFVHAMTGKRAEPFLSYAAARLLP